MSRDAMFETSTDQLPCGCALYAHDHRYHLSPCALHASASSMLAALRSASQALRSYQYGNSARDLAAEIADYADAVIAKATERSEARS